MTATKHQRKMRIAETSWINFRNLKPRRLEWRSGLHLLCGNNGSGKTNILEALNLMCGWGSFGGAKTRDLITFGSDKNAIISAEIIGEESFSVELSISSRVSMRVSKERQSCSELRMRLPALCFLPCDMNMIGGSPSIRRMFIDKLCALLSAPYAKRLSDYKRLLRHRVKLLRAGRDPEVTSHLMCSIGSWIWSVRKSVVAMLDENISAEISPVPLEIKLKGVVVGTDFPKSKDDFAEVLRACSDMERRTKIPLVGPHRDDLAVTSDGKDAFFSRGQKRRATIEMIIASGRVIEKKLRRKPIFLLDEISSELDSEGRRIVADALFETGWQIFAASAENSFDNWNGEVLEIKDGEAAFQ